jgi:hypothetical protein
MISGQISHRGSVVTVHLVNYAGYEPLLCLQVFVIEVLPAHAFTSVKFSVFFSLVEPRAILG